jgi:sulfatase-modifying factor enzyme 1
VTSRSLAVSALVNRDQYASFRNAMIQWFDNDVEGFRTFVRTLPKGVEYVARLPAGTPSIDTLVRAGLELLEADGVWETEGAVIFDALARTLPSRWSSIRAWEHHLLGTGDDARDRGPYGVVLVHCGELPPAAVAQEVARLLGVGTATAAAYALSAPAEIVKGMSGTAALRIGRALEHVGCVVSYHSPEGVPSLPRRCRSASGFVFARIPAGGAGPAGRFWLMHAPVTQEQFLALVKRDPSHHRGRRRLPVDNVSRDDALEFCARLSEREGLAGDPYRLSTEAEWEQAARADEATRYPGTDRWREVAHGVDGVETQPVCDREPNAWGLHDMAGNVWEWVADLEARPGTSGPSALGVLKGGCFDSPESDLIASARRLCPPGERHRSHGFRIARSSSPEDHSRDGRGPQHVR